MHEENFGVKRLYIVSVKRPDRHFSVQRVGEHCSLKRVHEEKFGVKRLHIVSVERPDEHFSVQRVGEHCSVKESARAVWHQGQSNLDSNKLW